MANEHKEQDQYIYYKIISKYDKPEERAEQIHRAVADGVMSKGGAIGYLRDAEKSAAGDPVAMATAMHDAIKQASQGEEQVNDGMAKIDDKIADATKEPDWITTKLTHTGPTLESMDAERTKAEIGAQKQQRSKDLAVQRTTARLKGKIGYFTEVGARGIKQIKEAAKNKLNIDLKGGRGLEMYKFKVTSKLLDFMGETDIKAGLENLRLEVGVELMNSVGRFRNPKFAKEFGQTLGSFSGNPYDDISKVSQTMAKSKFNDIETDPDLMGKTPEEKKKIVSRFETQAILEYNNMYIDMGIMPSKEIYWSGKDPAQVAIDIQPEIEANPMYQQIEGAASRFGIELTEDAKHKLRTNFVIKGSKKGWL